MSTLPQRPGKSQPFASSAQLWVRRAEQENWRPVANNSMRIWHAEDAQSIVFRTEFAKEYQIN